MLRAARPFPILTVAIVAILVLLGTLATLQYRWAGELREAEHARLRAAARTRADSLGRDFDALISRAFLELEMNADVVHARDFTAWIERYEAWQRASPWPRLVRALYLVEPRGRAPSLERYAPELRLFEPVEWPPDLAPLRRRLRPEGGERGWMLEPIVEEIPALILRAFDRKRREPAGALPPPGGPGPADATPFVVAVLDRTVIRDQLLPALAERHFGGPAGLDHELRVVRQKERGTTIWTSVPEESRSTRVDAAAGLLELRPEHAPPVPRGGPGFPARPYGEDSGRWRLEVANRAGPLDEVVTAARRRNLAVSFGVLLLLGAAVASIVVSAGRAQRLGERQMQFVSAVSHELRTPVAVIHSTSENLADGVIKDLGQMRVYGEVIRDESRRLAGMIEDVLAFAGASAPDRVRRDDRVEVKALIEEALEALASTLRARGFTIEREIEEGLPAVRGDADKLRHALLNLIENAMKYDGGRRFVAVRATFEGEATQVVLRVEDRGQGIAASDLPHVFEPFYRGQPARERQIHGFGLGLALVRRTVEDHGGRVSVTSAPGRGTTFTIRLPALPEAPPSLEDEAHGLPNPSV